MKKTVLLALLILTLAPLAVRAECSHEYSGNCDAQCDICDEPRTAPHTPNLTVGWCDGGDHHYIPCADCTHHIFSAPHDASTPIFNKDGHGMGCSVCGGGAVLIEHSLTVSKGNSKGHKYSCSDCDYSETEAHALTLEGNSDGHAYSCDCGYETAKEEHTYSSPCTVECAECGYQRIPPHEYGESVIDEKGHYYECALCHYIPHTEKHEREYEYNSLGHFSVCKICAYDFGFAEHTARDGGCACGYVEKYFPGEGDKPEYRILLWVLIGAAVTALVCVVILKRRRIAAFFNRLKKRIGIFRK